VNQLFEGVNKTGLAFRLMQMSKVFGWLCQSIFLSLTFVWFSFAMECLMPWWP